LPILLNYGDDPVIKRADKNDRAGSLIREEASSHRSCPSKPKSFRIRCTALTHSPKCSTNGLSTARCRWTSASVKRTHERVPELNLAEALQHAIGSRLDRRFTGVHRRIYFALALLIFALAGSL
jgi:hypothetical protein